MTQAQSEKVVAESQKIYESAKEIGKIADELYGTDMSPSLCIDLCESVRQITSGVSLILNRMEKQLEPV